MYILEGRGKGATWALLLETVHNEGVYITAGEQKKRFAISILDDMLIEGVISEHGKEYLKRHILHINEIRSRGHWRKKKFYIDSGLEILERYIAQEAAHRPEIIALGNDDEQIVHPRLPKELEGFKIEDSIKVQVDDEGFHFINLKTSRGFSIPVNISNFGFLDVEKFIEKLENTKRGE